MNRDFWSCESGTSSRPQVALKSARTRWSRPQRELTKDHSSPVFSTASAADPGSPEAGYASAQVVVHDRDGGSSEAAEVAALGERLADMPHVLAVSAPRPSSDGNTLLIDVRYDVPVTDPDLMGNLDPLEDAVEDSASAATSARGLRVPRSTCWSSRQTSVAPSTHTRTAREYGGGTDETAFSARSSPV